MEELLLQKEKERSMEEMHNFADESSSPQSIDQLQQHPYCLEVLSPFSATYEHNFCHSCLSQYWKHNHLHCLLCKENFTERSQIQRNLPQKDVADRRCQNIPENSDISCDGCTGVKQKALKSCLDCGVSLCQVHLEPHYVAPQYRKHKLINPVKNLEKYICQKHDRPLELFCKDDQMCLCQFCTLEEHRLHHTVPVQHETIGEKANLEAIHTHVNQMIQFRTQKIQEINQLVERSKRNTEREKSESAELFRVLIGSIERSQAELIEVMEEKQKAAEKQAEGFIKDLQQEITELKRRETELEQLLHTEEHLKLLQVYPSICTPPPTKNWTEISMNTDLDVGALVRTLCNLQETLTDTIFKSVNETFKETVCTELKRIQQYAVDVTLDSGTAHPYLILLDDGKQVRDYDIKRKVPNNPERFDKAICVLGKQGFSSRRFYYEVQVSGKTEWNLGVARQSFSRKGNITLKPENGVWSMLLKDGNELFVCKNALTLLSLNEIPQKVGVYVDYKEGRVSFYDVERSSHIYSFTGQTFTEKLYPFFSPGVKNKERNSAPLVITPVTIKTS